MGKGRKALAQHGGTAATTGDPARAQVLAAALAAIDPTHDDTLTHGFHSYPARMHYAVARTIIEAATEGNTAGRIDTGSGPNTRVLDPFCGSGTVLVEAVRRGLPATGLDLSPLALRLAEVKTARREPDAIATFGEAAAAIVAKSQTRVQDKVRVRAPIPDDERRWYDPHVLLELSGLHAEIETLPDSLDRRALQMVLSSMVVKFSRQRADTTDEVVQRNIAPGVPTRFFGRKAEELAERWTALAATTTKDAPRAQLRSGDARKIAQVVGPKRRYDLVLSSPPYGGTYDYVEHHRRRRAWLGLSGRELARKEIGARRTLTPRSVPRPEALRRWDTEVTEVLISIAAVVAGPQAAVILLVGDGHVAGKRVDAVAQLRRLAPPVGMQVVASASLPRPDWQGGPPRAEHLVWLATQSPQGPR